jgi:hypothetical protein
MSTTIVIVSAHPSPPTPPPLKGVLYRVPEGEGSFEAQMDVDHLREVQ